VSRNGRNDPCPCGSGRKTKRCCQVQPGPSERDLATARLAHHAARAARTLGRLTKHEVVELLRELPDLPARDLSLHLELPGLVSPDLDRLYTAIAADDLDGAEELLPQVLDRVDTPQQRARLADAITELERAGHLDLDLAAVAIIDLDSGSDLLITASLIQAAGLHAGATHTPGGLLLAA
jgi:SEC-C motif